MKTPIFLFIFLAGFALTINSCGNDGNSIETLEKNMAETPSPETAAQLANAYVAYAEKNPADAAKGTDYLLKASDAYYSTKNFPQGAQVIRKAIEMHPQEATTAIQSKMKDLRLKMYNDSTGRIDFAKANQFINIAETFAAAQKESEMAPMMLHQAGETARSIRDYRKAIEIYDMIYEQFPDFEKAPQALFLKAFTLDNDMQQKDQARELYELFLEKYPDNEFADDTQFLLENLGKDDEEIIQSFQEKQQES